jgi:putative flippase GtrA
MRNDRTLLLAYVANGLVATAVHFAVLWFNIDILKMPSAGAANFVAAIAGIGTSFAGNRWFVFGAHGQAIVAQATRYLALYAAVALLHGGVLWLWSDIAGLDYRIGFVLATCLQFVLTFFGNRYLVFRPAT